MTIPNRGLLAIIALLVALDLGLAVFWEPIPAAHERALPIPAAPPTGGDFQLDTAQGPVALQDFRGKVVLLYFGYTFCPDICPTSLLATAAALRALNPAELAQVQTIFVSVDPERDTVKQLADYVRFFHPSIIGATGAPDRIAEIAGRYGVSYVIQKPDANHNYVVDHSALTYLIDTDGRLVATLPHAAPAEQTLAAVRGLLPSSRKGATP
jgi:protein SCO1/2